MTHQIFRAAIAGLGESANRIQLPAIAQLPDLDLVAGCDPAESRREAAAVRWKVPRLFDTPEAMLAETQPDVLIVASPPDTHFRISRLGLENGCHVFCEKPFMPSLEEADQVIELAVARNAVLAVNNQYSAMPIFQAAIEHITAGRLGRVFQLDVWQHMHLPPEAESGWKRGLSDRRVLFEFGTHILDLACRFFDALPETVTAFAAAFREGSTSDHAVTARYHFPGGRVCSINLNRVSYAPMRYLEMRVTGERAGLRASYGGAARLQLGWNSERGRPDWRLNLTRGGELRLEPGEGRSILLKRQGAKALSDATRVHLAEFVRRIRSNDRSPEPLQHSRAVLAGVLAAYESIRQGGRLISLSPSKP